MKDSVGNEPIKIACIQTAPGKEMQVKEDLQAACRSLGIKRYLFLKGLGSFDIIFLYATDDFSVNLRQAGPIFGILKSNLLLCYPYAKKKVEEVFDLVSAKKMTSFCLLKISPWLRNYYPEIDVMLRRYIPQQADNWSVLGSLGWNELIIMISHDDVESICNDVFTLSSLYLKSKEDSLSVIIKTLSFIGINYGILPTVKDIQKGFERTKLILARNSSFRKRLNEGKLCVSATIEVTSKPMHVTAIKKYFRAKGFEPSDLLGKSDILLTPNEEVTWAHLLATVLHFRENFRRRVFATNTRIRLVDERAYPKDWKEIEGRIPPYKFEYSDVTKAFGKDMASTLANHFYTLNALFQNPLCGSVYADMANYPKYVVDRGKHLTKHGGESLHFAQGARKALTLGAELRSYGTYETIEEVTGRFSEFRGGCQLSLLATEFLPSHVFETLGQPWRGFVITGEPRFFHVNEVISVPNEALWNPQRWWALYHEIAHILIDYSQDWLSYDLAVVQQFLANKLYPAFWFDQLEELTAEVVGFELGFYGDYDTFFKLLWEHLLRIEPFQKKRIPLEAYALRTFFTKIFEGHFRKHAKVERVTRQDFDSLDYLYTELLKHMNLIEAMADRELFRHKKIVAAENAKTLRELYQYARHLSKKMSEEDLRPDKSELTLKNTKDIVESLAGGQIWWGKIDSPDAVLYHLFTLPNCSFSTRIATILTFWNQHMVRFKRRSR